MNLKQYFQTTQPIIDKALQRYLPPEQKKPTIIHRSMRYSMFAGGKRLRPVLVMSAAELCGKDLRDVLPAACALECIHTYSLVHDDLPAMDNDDLRRGRPTNHKAFGEDMAILAGDALLTDAFRMLALNAKDLHREKVLPEIITAVTRGAGTDGMIGGQVADVQSDHGRWKTAPPDGMKATDLLEFIHSKKTAALIQASLEVGALLAGGSTQKIKSLSKYGYHIGLAFQIKDDILDQIGDKKKLGKQGSDLKNDKLTYAILFGLEKSSMSMEKHVALAHSALKIFGRKASLLHELADFIIRRDH